MGEEIRSAMIEFSSRKTKTTRTYNQHPITEILQPL